MDGVVTKLAAGGAVAARFRVGGEPLMPRFVSGTLWVANHDGSLQAVDPKTGRVRARIRLGGGCNDVVSAGGLLWVGNQDGTVSVVDPATKRRVGARISVDPDVDGLAVAGGAVWAASYGGNSVSKIDIATRKS